MLPDGQASAGADAGSEERQQNRVQQDPAPLRYQTEKRRCEQEPAGSPQKTSSASGEKENRHRREGGPPHTGNLAQHRDMVLVVGYRPHVPDSTRRKGGQFDGKTQPDKPEVASPHAQRIESAFRRLIQQRRGRR